MKTEFKGVAEDWAYRNGKILCNANSDDPCRIITIATIGSTFPAHINEANAHLIEAAPKLLEALHGMLKLVANVADTAAYMAWLADEPECHVAKSAIQKALGTKEDNQ